jgi:hypothetical protein
VEVITNTVTIANTVPAGVYLLPLKVATSVTGVNIDQVEPIYIVVESFAAATAATVMNGDFEAPLPYMMNFVDWDHGYDVNDIVNGISGVWKHKYEWLSPENPAETPPSIAATGKTSIYEGQGPDGSDCLVIECSPGTFDYVLTQKITGLDPEKVYTLSAKVKMTDVTNTSKSAGIRIGYWPEAQIPAEDDDSFAANSAERAIYGANYKDFSGVWGEASIMITDVNSDGTTLIVIRFGVASADTDGKAYIDDVKIEEVIIEDTGELINGDFEDAVPLDTNVAPRWDSGSATTMTAAINALLPGKWLLFNGWTVNNATATQETSGAHSGSKCLKLNVNQSDIDGGWAQKITGLTPGDVYTVSAWAKSENITKISYDGNPPTGIGWYPKEEGAHLVWWEYDEAGEVFQTRPTSSECVRNVGTWTEMTLDVTVPSTGEIVIGVRVGGQNASMDGTFWFDDVTLTKK